MHPTPLSVLVIDPRRALDGRLADIDDPGFSSTHAMGTMDASAQLRRKSFDVVLTPLDTWEGAFEAVASACSPGDAGPALVGVAKGAGVSMVVEFWRRGAADVVPLSTPSRKIPERLRRALSRHRLRLSKPSFAELTERLTEILTHQIGQVDRATAGHVIRTERYARAMGSLLGMEGDELEELSLGAVAHDYGKVLLPNRSFLRSEGPLSPEDRRNMEDHPTLGSTYLAHHALLMPIARAVGEHHERWDGSGYPDGKRGHGISTGARIIGVADLFDSLSSARTYKEAWELDRCRDELLRERGQGFDPEAVDAFLKLLDREGRPWAQTVTP